MRINILSQIGRETHVPLLTTTGGRGGAQLKGILYVIYGSFKDLTPRYNDMVQ